MRKQNFSFNRTPSVELKELLMPGKFLSSFLNIVKSTKICGLSLDVHFRRLDCIHVYCGLTRVIVLKKLRANQQLKLSADKFYQKQTCGQQFLRKWHINDENFLNELEIYLKRVRVTSQHVSKEGAVQLKWSRVTNPWIAFDREIRLEYESIKHRAKLRMFEEVDIAFEELIKNYEKHRQANNGNQWALPKKTRIKLDQLAVSPDGRLTLIELKHSKGSGSEIYYSPFQLLQYIWEWHRGLDESPNLLKQVQTLLNARVDIGMTPQPDTQLTSNIRAAVCFGCDDRSAEIKRRYDIVLDVVNQHLPANVKPIETWEYSNACPRRIR